MRNNSTIKSKIWIHAIIGTRDGNPSISEVVKFDFHRKIVENFEKLDCPVEIINGSLDHVHILFNANPGISLAELIGLVKEKSADWVNGQDCLTSKFSWSADTYAFSVSESQSEAVLEHIRNQVAYHKLRSFDSEVNLFLKNYGLL